MTDQPPVFRERYLSTELGEAEQFLRDTYTDLALSLPRERDGFRLQHDTVAAGAIAMSRMGSTPAFDALAAPMRRIVVVDLRHGELTWTTDRYGVVRTKAGEIGLSPTVGTFHAAVEPSEIDLVALDPAEVGTYASHVCGLDADTLTFTDLVPRSPRLAALWKATTAHVRDDILADPDLAAAPIVVDGAFRVLAATLLSTFPNSALDAATDPEARPVIGSVPEASLREVIEYLHAHADDPVGPGDVAGVAGAPYREVVEGLRRRYETHPAELLWRARLQGARRDLEETDPTTGDTVAAIAARWGFTRLRTFALAYTMATDGETPEQTRSR